MSNLKMVLYVIVSKNLHGVVTQLGAYFNEEHARYAAGRIVGRDKGCFVSLETIDVLDEPELKPGDQIGQAQREKNKG